MKHMGNGSRLADGIRTIGSAALVLVMMLGACSIPVLFILGAEWSATHLLGPLITIGWIAIGVDLVILLPLSLFKGLRSLTGTILFLSSYVFGLVTWLLSFVLTYSIWGFWAVVAGLILFGGAVGPFALIATMLTGLW